MYAVGIAACFAMLHVVANGQPLCSFVGHNFTLPGFGSDPSTGGAYQGYGQYIPSQPALSGTRYWQINLCGVAANAACQSGSIKAPQSFIYELNSADGTHGSCELGLSTTAGWFKSTAINSGGRSVPSMNATFLNAAENRAAQVAIICGGTTAQLTPVSFPEANGWYTYPNAAQTVWTWDIVFEYPVPGLCGSQPPATTAMPTTAAATSAAPTATTTVAPLATTSAPIPPPVPTRACRLNGVAFDLPYVTVPMYAYDTFNGTEPMIQWTFSLCEPTTVAPDCGGGPAYVFQHADPQNTVEMGPCVSSFPIPTGEWSTVYEQGLTGVQRSFSTTAQDAAQGIVTIAVLCGATPPLNPGAYASNWQTTSQQPLTWAVTLYSSNVPGCVTNPPSALDYCVAGDTGGLFSLPLATFTNINVTTTSLSGAVATTPETWVFNLCSPLTYASVCGGGSDTNTSDLPVYLYRQSKSGSGCDIAFTAQSGFWLTGPSLLSTLFYSLEGRYFANVTLTAGAMAPLWSVTPSWTASPVDDGRQTMFNMYLSSTQLPWSNPTTSCAYQDGTTFTLPWVNVSAVVNEYGTDATQLWFVSPCFAIQNYYCSAVNSAGANTFVTQQSTPTSSCMNAYGLTPNNNTQWSQLPTNNGVMATFQSLNDAPEINVTIRCCATCSALEVDPLATAAWSQGTGGTQIFLASSSLPVQSCSPPTQPPIPNGLCWFEGYNFNLPFLNQTLSSQHLDGSLVDRDWALSLCQEYQPIHCFTAAAISVVSINGESCVHQFGGPYGWSGQTVTGGLTQILPSLAAPQTYVNVTILCNAEASALQVLTPPVQHVVPAYSGPVWFITLESSNLPSNVCHVPTTYPPSPPLPPTPPPAPPGPSVYCFMPGMYTMLFPSISMSWPLFVPNARTPVVMKQWNVSLCAPAKHSTCSSDPQVSFFIMSMAADDAQDCQVAFTSQSQPWESTSYNGNGAVRAVFANAAGDRLANVTVVYGSGTSALQPFTPDTTGNQAGWLVTRVGDAYVWNLFFTTQQQLA